MKPGEARSSWGFLPALLLAALAGCATDRARVEKSLMAERSPSAVSAGVSEQYLVGCPDVIELQVPNRPELSGNHAVEPDGRIALGEYGRLRVEGQPLMEIARQVAAETGTDPEQVKARVAEFRSQYVLLFGQVIGWQRTVAYQGQETVLELLQRVGGITKGAEPEDIHVVRAHIGDSQRPEVFRVDLKAIVVNHDEKTNIRVLPYDQIYVGATRQYRVEKVLPPWLRRVYQAVWDTHPAPREAATARAPLRSRWVAGPRVGMAREETGGEE